MKAIKLSLATALVASSFSALNAVSLEEAIKNVDFSGQLRYRNDTGNWDASKGEGPSAQGTINAKQNNSFRVKLNAKADIADNFKVFGQVQYNADKNGGYKDPAVTGNSLNLRQAYLQYDYSDVSVILGKQEFGGTVWTDDMVTMAAKLNYTGIAGLKLSAFAIDSFEDDSDRAFYDLDSFEEARNKKLSDTDRNDPNITAYKFGNFLFDRNLYGVSGVSSYDLGGSSIDSQLWLGYLDKRAFLYAVNVKYALNIAENVDYSIKLDYMGNTLDASVKDKITDLAINGFRASTPGQTGGESLIDNGNFVSLAGTLKAYSFDAGLGGYYYGKKGKFTINRLEDADFGITPGGHQILLIKGSNITNSFGQTTIGYVKAGYTFPAQVRLGAQFAYGTTQAGELNKGNAEFYGGGNKMEVLVEASYKYSDKLNFLLWYSYLDWKAKDGKQGATPGTYVDAKNNKDTIRFQAVYNF